MQVRAFGEVVSEQHGSGDQVGVHGGWHVRHQGTEEGGHREGLLGRGEQGHQGLRQVLLHPKVHDLQLERFCEYRGFLSCVFNFFVEF